MICYFRDERSVPPEKLTLEQVDADAITGFLAWLRTSRHNSALTCNQRLAAIDSLFTWMQSRPRAQVVFGHAEASFRMSKHDLQARPIYHHKRESIEAHLSIVFAALAISRHIEAQTGWSIRKFVRTARCYRTIQIRAGTHILTAEDPLPTDLRDALALIN